MSRTLANTLLLLTALIWGSAFVAQATAMQHVGPLTFTGIRFLMAALAVLPFAIAETRQNRRAGKRTMCSTYLFPFRCRFFVMC